MTSPIDRTFRSHGSGTGMTSPSGPAGQEEVRVQARRQDDVDRREDVSRDEARRREARLPDRHEAAVDQDRGRVEPDADQRKAHAGPRSIHPQPDRERAVRRRRGGAPGASRRSRRLARARLPSPGGARAPRRSGAAIGGGSRSGCRSVRRRRSPRSDRRPARRSARPSWARTRRRERRPGAGGGTILAAAWASSGTGRASGARPASATSFAHDVRRKASTMTGSNCTPAYLRSSAIACSGRQRAHPVRPRGRHRLERVRHVQDSRQLRNLVAHQAIRVPRAVVPLVMVPNDRQLRRQLRDVGDDVRPDHGVAVHQRSLVFRQLVLLQKHVVRYADLPDIVQKAAPLERLDLIVLQTHQVSRCRPRSAGHVHCAPM